MKQRIFLLTAVLAVLLCGCRGAPIPSETAAVPEYTQTQPAVTVPEAAAEETIPAEPAVTEPAATEPPATEPTDETFVRIADYVPNVRVELAYATEENFTGTVIYEFCDAWLRFGTAEKLARAAELLEAEGYGILIWDAYRPVYAQERLWEICPDPAYVSKPGTGSQSHCRGIAVDLTLYDLNSGEVPAMPTGFDEFTALADRDYSDCSAEAAEHAALLENMMKECGFKPYSAEWWHFSDTESYGIETEFDPADMD